jgi:hypothetical protein
MAILSTKYYEHPINPNLSVSKGTEREGEEKLKHKVRREREREREKVREM